MVELLLDNRANIAAKDREGAKPYSLYSPFCHGACPQKVFFLRSFEATSRVVFCYPGSSALDLAKKSSRSVVVELLEKRAQ